MAALQIRKTIAGLFSLFSGQGARAGYLAAADQALISLANFAATILLARSASPTELGIYSVGFTALRLVRAFQDALTIQPLNTFGAGMDESAFRRYATSVSLIQILLASASALSVALLGWGITALGNDTAGPTLFHLWSGFLWWQMQEYIRRMLYTRGRVLDAALNTALANFVRLGLMAWWAGQGRLDGTASLNAIALGSLAALLPGMWQTRRFWSRSFDNLLETWRINWRFGRWVLGGGIAAWVSVEFYPVLTAGLISFAAAGAYRALQNIVAPIFLLLRALDTFLTPRAARCLPPAWPAGAAAQPAPGLPGNRAAGDGFPGAGPALPGPAARAALRANLPGIRRRHEPDGGFLCPAVCLLAAADRFQSQRSQPPPVCRQPAAIAAMFSAGIWMIARWGVYGTIGGQILNALVVLLVLAWSWRRFTSAERSAAAGAI